MLGDVLGEARVHVVPALADDQLAERDALFLSFFATEAVNGVGLLLFRPVA
jgi:hypothetical protein